MSLKRTWTNLHPKYKRATAIAGGLLAIFVVVHLFGSSTESDSRSVKRNDAIRNVLTDRNPRDISIDSLSANMTIVKRENDELKKDLKSLKAELEKAAANSESAIGLERQLDQLRDDLLDMKAEAAERNAADEAKPANKFDEEGNPVPVVATQLEGGPEPAMPLAEGSLLERYKNANEVFERAPSSALERHNPQTGEVMPLSIKSFAQVIDEPVEQAVEEEDVYMPVGSILTGTLINGLDAPTGQGARRDPFPATIRLQKEAILPNRFQADVRECFLIVSGYGELSNERAMLRGESISCIREDGGVIESKVQAYVVGEDGKAGVRGRLVSKQGQIIAKSLVAGFASGMASAFDVNPVPVLNTAPDGRTQYQSTFSNDMMQGAAMKGASSALDRVADFYIDMAESMFPVIEIDAGRQVDIILNGGLSLKLKKGTN